MEGGPLDARLVRLALRDVGHHPERRVHVALARQGHAVEVDPHQAAVLAPHLQLAAVVAAAAQHRVGVAAQRGEGVFVDVELAHRQPEHLVGVVAEELFQRAVLPDDAPAAQLGDGDHIGVQHRLLVQRQAAQVLGHRVGQRLRPSAAGREQVGRGRQQRRQQQADQARPPARRVDHRALVGGRQRGLEPERPSGDLHAALGRHHAEVEGGPRARRGVQRLDAGAGVEQQVLGRGVVVDQQAEIHRRRRQAFLEPVQDLLRHQRRVEQAQQRLAPLGGVDRIGAVAEHRHQQQHAGAVRVVLHQRHRRRQRGLAGGDGALDRAPPDRLRAQVEAPGRVVLRQRLDVRDDEQVGRVAPAAHGELRRAVGALGGDEGGQVSALDPRHEAEAAHAGEFARQVARLDVGAEGLPVDAPAQRGQRAARALEAVHRLDEALDDVALQPLHLGVEQAMGLGHDAVAVPQHRAERQRQAGQQHQQRADDGGHRQVAGRGGGRGRWGRERGREVVRWSVVHGRGGGAAGRGHSRVL